LLPLPVAAPLLAAALAIMAGLSGAARAPLELQKIAVRPCALTLRTWCVALLILSIHADGRSGSSSRWGCGRRRMASRSFADALTGVMLTVTWGCCRCCCCPTPSPRWTNRAFGLNYYPMALLLLMGANGAFITGDLFNLYVFYEVLLMSSFVLLALGGTPSQINGAIRYVVLNLMGSMMLLLAAGITYGTVGTLNMAQISERMGMAP
jgi:multicomponent Na+:H+ antiporter subunit D